MCYSIYQREGKGPTQGAREHIMTFKKYRHSLTRTYMDAHSIFGKCYHLDTDNRANSKAWLEEVKKIEQAEGVKLNYFTNCANGYVGSINKH